MAALALSLGTNLGDRQANLRQATELIAKNIGPVARCSAIYETEAWGFDSYPFLNQVVIVNTDLSPIETLDILQEIEKQMGRTEKSHLDPETRRPVYAARTIDLDILLYDDLVLQSERLTIPHPLISQRRFVLEPLAELFKNQIVTPFTSSFTQLLKNA